MDALIAGYIETIEVTVIEHIAIKKIDKILKKFSYKSYAFLPNKKKFKLVNKKYPLNTFFLQKKHLP